MQWLGVALGALLSATASGAGNQGDEALTVRAIRFYQPASGTTTIEGVAEVRLAAVARAAAVSARYRLEIAVLDSTGLVLRQSGWEREVSSRVVHSAGASAVETFRFAAAPGRYRIRVRALPERGEAIERSVEVSAYAARPLLSDLLLATSARAAASDSDTVSPGEVRRAGLAMRTAPVPTLTFTDATLAYYAEIYPWSGSASEGQLVAQVLGPGGRRVLQVVPRAVRVQGQGGLSRGSIDLAGLPAGMYRLRLELRMGDSAASVESEFAMSEPRPALEVAVEAPDLFAEASEERLDSLQAPLIYLEEEAERGQYQRLTLEAKRNFLREFWRRRDPTPATAENEALAQFYAGVQYANQEFREGGAAEIPGWRTDRGRIYLKRGRPDEVLRRPLGQGGSQPYEVWKYTRGRPLYFLFWDQSGFGHFSLLVTNDRTEVGQPDWERRFSREAVDDIARFLRL